MTPTLEGQDASSSCSFSSPQNSKLRQRWDVEPHTERPPDDLGLPVPIYTASRWCLSAVRQEGVSSNCVKPHIVKADKESLLSSWHEVQVKHTGECERVSKRSQLAPVLSATHTHVCHINERSTSSDPSPVLSLFSYMAEWWWGGANIPFQINPPACVNRGLCFFSFWWKLFGRPSKTSPAL